MTQTMSPPAPFHEVRNAFTVDVEDYYQVSAFEGLISRSDWDSYPSRVVANTRRLLRIAEKFGLKGTFFVLGWVAEKHPDLVREIASAGHEIGSHSFWHNMAHKLRPEQFRQDLRCSKRALEDICHRPITMFRAPSFSITAASQWALQILAEEGFEIDSSIFPVRHDRYGMPNACVEPHIVEGTTWKICEFPPSILSIGLYRLPIAGGGYFRAFPKRLTLHAIRRCNRLGRPFMFYLHPWELDPEQPAIAGARWRTTFRHRMNLASTEQKLIWLLNRVSFGTISQCLQQFEIRERRAA